LQFCFWYSQISEHHLERFLLGAPFGFSFIHSILDAWDLQQETVQKFGELHLEMKQEFLRFHF